MALEQLLKEHRFTHGFDERHIAKLASFAALQTFQQDDVILISGERSNHFYLVTSGSVCIEVRARAYTVCVQVLGPTEAFGWSSVLDQHDTLFHVRAQEPCTLIRLGGAQLATCCEEDSVFGLDFFRRLLGLVATRVKATETRLAEFCGISSLPKAVPPVQ